MAVLTPGPVAVSELDASGVMTAASQRVVTAPRVTRLIGAVDLLIGLGVITMVLALGLPWWHAMPFAVVVGTAAVAMLLLPPPDPASRAAHWHALSSAGKPVLAAMALWPDPIGAVPLLGAASVFIAFRVQQVAAIAAYLALSVLGLVVIAAIRLDLAMVAAVVTAVPVTAGVGFAVTWVIGRVELLSQALDIAVGTDPLTGVANRRTLDDTLAYELARHARTGTPCAVLTIDLNGFKALNDREGHPAGDALLVRVADALRGAVRAGDTVTRPGGDEFCLILPGTSAAEASAVKDGIRRALARITIDGAPLTAGVGVASFPVDGRDADALLRAADRELYADKRFQRAAR